MDKKASLSISAATLGYKKSRHEISILKDVDLDFYAADFVAIVGLNGTGKSTLLRSLCGLLPLLNGAVYLNGKSIKELSLEEVAKKIAIVLTEKISGFNLTAYDVVAAGQMPYTDSFNRLSEKNSLIIDSAIEMCGLKNQQHKLVGELSDGSFQKTVIAKALAQQTPVMLLDEPSAFLDYASKHDLFILLKKLAEQNSKCVLVSTHDLDLALKYCNKLLVVSEEKCELILMQEAKKNEAFLKIGGGFI